MRIGKFRKRVRFEAETKTSDGAGGNTRSWVTIATVWCEYAPERGTERMERGHLEAVNNGILRVRYSDDIAGIVLQSSRAVIEGAIHQIVSIIDPDGRKRMLEMVIALGVAPHGV